MVSNLVAIGGLVVVGQLLAWHAVGRGRGSRRWTAKALPTWFGSSRIASARELWAELGAVPGLYTWGAGSGGYGGVVPAEAPVRVTAGAPQQLTAIAFVTVLGGALFWGDWFLDSWGPLVYYSYAALLVVGVTDMAIGLVRRRPAVVISPTHLTACSTWRCREHELVPGAPLIVQFIAGGWPARRRWLSNAATICFLTEEGIRSQKGLRLLDSDLDQVAWVCRTGSRALAVDWQPTHPDWRPPE